MSKAIRDKAKELLGFGMPKQAVFDTIVIEHAEAKPKRIADVVRYLPTLASRERYRNLHLLLLGLIVLYGALRVAQPILAGQVDWALSYRLVSLAPIATVLLGWSVWRWQGQVFQWVGWMNLLGAPGLLKALGRLNADTSDTWPIGLSALSVGIGALALYLAHRVFAKHKVEKDPVGGPERCVFPEEAGR